MGELNTVMQYGALGLLGLAILIISKLIDKHPAFKNGHNDRKTAEHLDSVAKSCEKMTEIIAGPYGRRPDGTFKVHNLPEIEAHIRETKETVDKVERKLTEATGG